MQRIVSREEWIAERKRLLLEEKELTRRRDALAEKRQALPWVKVEKNYEFDSPQGRVALRELFRGRSQRWASTTSKACCHIWRTMTFPTSPWRAPPCPS
jgi:predicted dithiol-disulfide oxidoreductase (DUF899 family)